MHSAVKAKFCQNKDLALYLTGETSDVIAEESKDVRFGIGHRLNDVLKTKSVVFLGENILGKILEQVKAELKSAKGNSSA